MTPVDGLPKTAKPDLFESALRDLRCLLFKGLRVKATTH
jgi:hypothetical protein